MHCLLHALRATSLFCVSFPGCVFAALCVAGTRRCPWAARGRAGSCGGRSTVAACGSPAKVRTISLSTSRLVPLRPSPFVRVAAARASVLGWCMRAKRARLRHGAVGQLFRVSCVRRGVACPSSLPRAWSHALSLSLGVAATADDATPQTVHGAFDAGARTARECAEQVS